jgi:hypothetical protein
LTSVSSRLGFRAGAATPSGVMISFPPPRRWSRIGMRMVRSGYESGNLTVCCTDLWPTTADPTITTTFSVFF